MRFLTRSKPQAPARLPGFDYAEDPRIERMVFICGLHRSGTTLLEHYLASHFELSILRATVPENEGQHIQTVYSTAKSFGGPGRFAFNPALGAELEALGTDPALGTQILDQWKPFVVGNAPALLEKSPPNLARIGWLRKVFPGARFVILTRDPRAAAAATQKWAKTSLPELMMHWNVAHSAALADMREDDCHVLRYEDLCEDAEAAIAASGLAATLTRRAEPVAIEDRFATFRNSNARYFELHEGTRYGRGAWDEFGYSV